MWENVYLLFQWQNLPSTRLLVECVTFYGDEIGLKIALKIWSWTVHPLALEHLFKYQEQKFHTSTCDTFLQPSPTFWHTHPDVKAISFFNIDFFIFEKFRIEVGCANKQNISDSKDGEGLPIFNPEKMHLLKIQFCIITQKLVFLKIPHYTVIF